MSFLKVGTFEFFCKSTKKMMFCPTIFVYVYIESLLIAK